MASSLNIMNDTTLEVRKHGFISDEMYTSIHFYLMSVACCILSIIGIGTNIVNIVTFVKLGFKETINISLTALAVSDLGCLVFLLWMSICYNPSFRDLVCKYMNSRRVANIVGGTQRAFFSKASGCITCFIAFERCLCVLMPLRVKFILTKGKIVITLLSIFILVKGMFVPLYYVRGLGRVFDPETNRSIITLIQKENSFGILDKTYATHTTVGMISYIVVTICTVAIVWKIASQSAWRAARSNDNNTNATGNEQKDQGQADNKKGLTGKDKRATNTVIIIAILYIVCYFPASATVLAMSISPEFNYDGKYRNIYSVCWALNYVSEAICSGVNIVVYLKTSTKFREVFCGLFTAH